MTIEDIKTNEDVLRFIRGCLNDFEAGISDRNETEMNIINLISHVAQIAVNKH